ncbi:ubiquinol-cytochrome-c reductase complex assembly factor 2-like isoform X1 [Branchiostoma floridae x Branchiostoma japonicum]
MARYKQFLRICQHWPLDSTKEGRDIAVAIRQAVVKAFKEGENTQVNPAECDRVYTSLERLNNGHWNNKYPRRKPTTFTGLTLEDYRLVLASGNQKVQLAAYEGEILRQGRRQGRLGGIVLMCLQANTLESYQV